MIASRLTYTIALDLVVVPLIWLTCNTEDHRLEDPDRFLAPVEVESHP
jgi:hypothetical protein